MSELVSGALNSLLAGENTGNFVSPGLPRAINGFESGSNFIGLKGNSLRVGTGKLFRPYRELNRSIREVFVRIRDFVLAPIWDPYFPTAVGFIPRL
jgi:hypothetical protein